MFYLFDDSSYLNICTLKLGLSPSKKSALIKDSLYLLQLKIFKDVENAFYFILKAETSSRPFLFFRKLHKTLDC